VGTQGGNSGKPEILFLCHRIPYPPDKGDKIRSYRWLRALATRYRVHLVAFADDPADLQHQGFLATLCETCRVFPLDRRSATLRALLGLLNGQALSLLYYSDDRVRRWLEELLGVAEIKTVVVYSSAMAQYVQTGYWERLRRVIDFVDLDSDKWRQYACRRRGPMRWLYRREAERLERFEIAVARAFDQSMFVSRAEAAFFKSRVGDGGTCAESVSNGVDAEFFQSDAGLTLPLAGAGPVVVFTGFMSYWANVDAVRWFVHEVWPEVLRSYPNARFIIVGAQPTDEVLGLASDSVLVTGRVADVRPYLQMASVVVAPMRIARGIQNKVLEGMAMGRPVVLTENALEGIDAAPGRDVLVANDSQSISRYVVDAIAGRWGGVGAAARQCVLAKYSWERHCVAFLDLVEGCR
jgi:sugar transferase (PEP-CTERM/EpsH1 system associated)